MNMFSYFQFFGIFLTVFCIICAVDSSNTNETILLNDNDFLTNSDGLFGSYLIQWALTSDENHREGRVMQMPATTGGFVASKFTDINKNSREPGKIVNRPSVSSPQYSASENLVPNREVSETDLYLLGATEKLAYKMDFLEKRVRKLEEMLYYTVAGNKIDKDPCPPTFIHSGDGCYYFSEKKADWQIANKLCRKMGAKLVESETLAEKREVTTQILSRPNLKGIPFWTGGLNPGLLWIWSSSAKPIVYNSKNKEDEIKGSGRCLGFVYNSNFKNYVHQGQNCSTSQYFICELIDTTNYIPRLEKS